MQVELSSPSISRPQAAPFDILLGSDLQLEVALLVPARQGGHVAFLGRYLRPAEGSDKRPRGPMCASPPCVGETAMWFSTWISSFKWSANVRMLFPELDDLQRRCSQDPTPSAIVVSSALGYYATRRGGRSGAPLSIAGLSVATRAGTSLVARLRVSRSLVAVCSLGRNMWYTFYMRPTRHERVLHRRPIL